MAETKDPVTSASAGDAKTDAKETGEKRKPEEEAESPDAKRLKATPVDKTVIRKQVEYYLSDQNLMYDKFFHEKISENAEGWLDMSLILSCNKMKAMRATKELVLEALKDSPVEVKDVEGSTTCVRRPENKALPQLQQRTGQQQYQKKKPHAHDGGVILVVKDVPEEQTWMQIKDELRKKLPEKVAIMFASSVSEKSQCVLAITPFEGDLALFDGLELTVGGASLKTEICYGDMLQQSLKLLPKNVRERREKQARARQKERQRPIVLANQRFANVGAVRGRIKTILSSRSDGEVLNKDGSDYKLVHAVLGFHPRFKEKTEKMTDIKIDTSEHGNSRCFWIVKGDVCEDFSANKCLNALELDPPYVQDTPAKVDEKKDDAKAEGDEKKEEAKAEGDAKKEDKTEGDAKKEDAK
jgi:hypothetical protein